MHPLTLLVFLCPAVAAADGPPPPPPLSPYDATPWLVGSSIAFFFLLYLLLALASWPYMRYQTGWSILVLVLIVLFPPSFMFLLVYLLVLRCGVLAATTRWVWGAPEREEVVVVAVVDTARRKGAASVPLPARSSSMGFVR